MNAPARLTAQQVAAATPLDPANLVPTKQAAWERYLPTVDALCPGAGDEERRDRAGLMLLRDMAERDIPRLSWEAGSALVVVRNIASARAGSSLNAEDLRTTRLALIRLYTGARELEKVYGGG